MKDMDKMLNEVVVGRKDITALLRENRGVYGEIHAALGRAARLGRRVTEELMAAYRRYAAWYIEGLAAVESEILALEELRVADALRDELASERADYRQMAKQLRAVNDRQQYAATGLRQILEAGTRVLERLELGDRVLEAG